MTRRVCACTLWLFLVCAAPALAYDFDGGDGSANIPYLISTAAQLTSIGNDENLLDKHFRLIADIDLAGAGDNADGTFSKAVIAWDPTPANSTFEGLSFTGVFDGNGHTISNMTINATATAQYYLALFGVVGQASIINLTVDNFHIEGYYYPNYAAGIAGYFGYGYAENCFAKGSISFMGDYQLNGTFTPQMIGGLFGQIDGTFEQGIVKNCGADVEFQNPYAGIRAYHFGGLAGCLHGGIVEDCFAVCNYTNAFYQYCATAGSFIGLEMNPGRSKITNCVYLPSATYPAGIGATQNDYDTLTAFTATQMQNEADFLALGWDFVGETTNGSADCWQMGTNYPLPVMPAIIITKPSLHIKEGLSATFDIYLSSAPADDVTVSITAAGDDDAYVLSGYETIVFTPANYSVPRTVKLITNQDDNNIEETSIVTLSSSVGGRSIDITKTERIYNFLNDNAGDGTAENPFLINTVEQLLLIGDNATLLAMHFKLTADIDLAGLTFDKAVIAPSKGESLSYFSGSFDGAGHVIDNLTITTSANTTYVGFIGMISSGQIRNLGLTNVTINLAQGARMVGAFTGYFYNGIMQQCYATGSITFESGVPVQEQVWNSSIGGFITQTNYDNESWYVGGLCGNIYGSGIAPNYLGYLEDCYSDVAMECTGPGSARYVGGIAGYISASYQTPAHFKHCYAAAPVPTTNVYPAFTAGFAGYAGLEYNSSYSYATFEDCFWNTETTTQASGVLPASVQKGSYPYFYTEPVTYTGISAMTSPQMADQTQFVNWDFEGNTNDGIADIWRMATDRPVLSFEDVLDISHTSITLDEGTQTELQIAMKYQPAAETTVTIDVTGCPSITASPASLTFDSTNYQSVQTVTITSEQDMDWQNAGATVVLDTGSATNEVFVTKRDDDENPDLNRDAWIDLTDFAILSRYWNTTNPSINLSGGSDIDAEDLAMLACNWEPVRMYGDDFETGDLTALPWVLTQDSGSGWIAVSTITNSAPYDGAYCAGAYGGNFDHCSMSIQDVDVTGFNTLRFALKTSTEGNFDFLRFYAQKQGESEVEIMQWSGETNWTVYEYELKPGVYTFRWAFTKDYTDSYGQDMVWIDNIELLRLLK